MVVIPHHHHRRGRGRMTPLRGFAIVIAVLAAGLVIVLSWRSGRLAASSPANAPPAASAPQGAAPAR